MCRVFSYPQAGRPINRLKVLKPDEPPRCSEPSLRADSVEKGGISTRSNFFAPWVWFSYVDAGGLIIRLRVNGASCKSICGGN